MKKLMQIITVVCLTMTLVFTPIVYSLAAESACPPHVYSATHTALSEVFLSSHPVYIGDGPTGPIYETCHIYGVYEVVYPRCTACGYIDYANPYSSTLIGYRHDNSNCPYH